MRNMEPDVAISCRGKEGVEAQLLRIRKGIKILPGTGRKSILARNLVAFCPCPETLSVAELKSDRRMCMCVHSARILTALRKAHCSLS